MSARFPLTEPQERHWATILGHLERAVVELRGDIGEAPARLTLTEYEDRIGRELAEPLGELIAKVKAGIERVAREVELPRSRDSILRRHLARLQLLSIDLYATLPSAGLRGYGDVAPETARYLEEEIPRLEALVSGITAVLEGKR